MVLSGSGLSRGSQQQVGKREAEAVGGVSAPGQALGELGWSQLAPWVAEDRATLGTRRRGSGKQTAEEDGAEAGALEEGWGRAGEFHKKWSGGRAIPSAREG